MIRRRALVSLKHHQPQAQQSRTTKPFSPFSTSSSPFANPKPSFGLLFSSSSLSNQKRFSVGRLVPFTAAPWNSSSIGYVKTDGGVLGVRKISTRTMNNESSNRPPKETILLDGCDFEHWLVVLDAPDPNLTRDEIINSYIQTLAQIVGSEEEARKRIYSVSTKHYFAFSCIVTEELSYKIKELPKVRWVLPDSYLDVPNKNYGGEPFIDGQAVPYDPKYHEIYLHNKRNSEIGNRRNKDRRRNDRTSTVERRRENTTNRDMAPPSSNPISHVPMTGPNQNFIPAPNYQNQVPSPPTSNRDFSNRGAPLPGPNTDPSQMPNPDYQRMDMQPEVQNNHFQNRSAPIQNRNFQSNYAPVPAQNREFQSRDAPSMRNTESPGRNMPPLPPTEAQNWNSPSRNTQPSMQNQYFQSNVPPSMQSQHLEIRGMPPVQNPGFQNGSNMHPVQNPGFTSGSNMPPVQNPGFTSGSNMPPVQTGFQNGSNMPPVQNPGFRNGNNMPPVQNLGFQNGNNMPSVQKQGFQNGNNLSPPVQNWGMPHPVQSPRFQNVPPSNVQMPTSTPNYDYQGNDMPHRVQNYDSQFRHTGNVQPGYNQNRDISIGVTPNNQNREMPGYTNSMNMPNRNYQGRDMPSNINKQNAQIDQQGWDSSYNTEMINSPSKDQPSLNMSNGEYEAVANGSF